MRKWSKKRRKIVCATVKVESTYEPLLLLLLNSNNGLRSKCPEHRRLKENRDLIPVRLYAYPAPPISVWKYQATLLLLWNTYFRSYFLLLWNVYSWNYFLLLWNTYSRRQRYFLLLLNTYFGNYFLLLWNTYSRSYFTIIKHIFWKLIFLLFWNNYSKR